jgi:hypothetical protein
MATHTIDASFVEIISDYTITASAGGNGTITPSGAVSVAPGSNQTFTIQAATNYVVETVLVDGTNVGAVTTYTFTNVMATHTIAATFDLERTSSGIPYVWISQFGITPDETASTNDVDGDGEDLFNEWLKSTDPSDAESYLQITPWVENGTNYILWVTPDIDTNSTLPPFMVLGSTNLTNGVWVPETTDAGRQTTNIWSAPMSIGPIFLRVGVPTP